jgi:hypothetical protein
MPQHHLDALSHALTQRGWKIVSTRSLEDFPYDCHAWSIERGRERHEIQFDRFDAMGYDVPLIESYGCSVEGRKASLYFSNGSRWSGELDAFLSELDAEGQ